MAVFPDRIVLKNSTDSQAQIEAAIQSGGSDEISQGEVVIGLTTGAAALYTKDAVGTIVTLSGKVASVNNQIDDVVIDVENLGNFQYGVDPTKQSFVLSGPSNNIPSTAGMWDIGSNFNNYFAWYDTDPIHSWLSTVPVGTAIEFVTRWGYKHTAVTSTVASTYASGADHISFAGYPWPQELLNAQANNEFIVVQEQNAFLTPQDGEALLYEASTGLWRPASTSGSVSSVNGFTGAVSIGVEDLDDYLPQPGTHPVAYHSDKQSVGDWSGSNSSVLGGYSFDNPSNGDYEKIYINKNTPTSGTSLASQGFIGGTTLDLWVSADGVTFTQHTATNSYNQSSNNALFSGLSPNLNAYFSASALYFSLSAPSAPAPLADGDILQYESATSAWRPVPSTGLGGSVASIDDIGDVDTTTVAPTDGQTLVWDDTAQQWEPGLPATALPVAQDGEALIWQGGEWVAGPVIGGVDYTPAGTDPNIADVSLLLLFNGGNGSTTFTDSSPNALTVTPSGNAQISTTEFKYGGSSGYFDGTGDKIVVASDPGLAFAASDDFTIEFWVWPADGADVVENGGILISDSATSFTTGVSQIVYDHPQARNSVSIWNYADGGLYLAEAQVPTKDTWYHIAFVKSGTTITPYVNGVAGGAGTTNNAWDFSDGGTAIGEYYGYSASGTTSGAFTGYLDDLRVTKGVARYTSNFTPPTVQLGTSAGDIVIPYSIDKLDDVDTSTVAPTDGQALVWDNAAQQWEPGSVAASAGGGAGRGDGGDFDTGTVDSAYVFGVYGGGDFDAGSASTTAVAPFAHAYIDSNNISSTTAHTGMSSAAHVYVASTDSYIDFTFDTAQPNTGYSVLHSGEAGWNVLEVENKTTSGFRVSFYDEATGNVLSTGAVGIGAPVITVYDSDPTITVSSSSGVDLPAELLGDDEGPDGGSF